ncbi:hypothetical protein F6Y02_40845 (plasmid) [Bacillus megaterium]|nr:hypothetical protein [Priestia megaterium]
MPGQHKSKRIGFQNGYHKSEVDLMIRAYLQGEEYVPKKQPPKEKKSRELLYKLNQKHLFLCKRNSVWIMKM